MFIRKIRLVKCKLQFEFIIFNEIELKPRKLDSFGTKLTC